MYPEQQPATPPANNYDFIMNANKPSKPKMGGGISSNPFIMKLIFLIGGVVVLMIVVAVLLSIFTGSKVNIDDLVGLTKTEQEIIRLSDQAGFANSQGIKNAAVNTQVGLVTHQKAWQTFLSKQGRAVVKEELNAKKNEQTDKTLKAAKQTSTFDNAYVTVMRAALEAYAVELKAAYPGAYGQTERDLLDQHYQEVNLLLKQWPS